MIAPVTPIPGTALVACANVAHRVAFKPKEGCPACKLGRGGPAGSDDAPAGNARRITRPAHPAPSRGKQHEDALAVQLAEAGWPVMTYGAWLRTALMIGWTDRDCVREWPWGWLLEPQRRFRADFAFPLRRLLVEVEGGCHGIQKQRKADILRAQLAASVGYTILRVLPEQVHDKSALALVRGAVEASCGIKVEEVTKEAR